MRDPESSGDRSVHGSVRPAEAVPSRRDFLARASLLGLGIPTLSGILAGCEGGGGGPAAAGAGAESATTKPQTESVPYARYDPTLPPVGEGNDHEFHFVARDETVLISNDTAMRAWTFNGTVPGPILHVRQGDNVRIRLSNEASIAHSIDLHAARIDPGTAFRSIGPGESLTYSFRAERAGAFLYHCGTAPILLHIGNGMYGAIIVDPATPLPPAREFVLVHSSFYLDRPQKIGRGEGSASGQKSSQDSAAAGGAVPGRTEREVTVYDTSYEKMLYAFPDFTAFNGIGYQYRQEPIRVKQGELVRLYVVSAGPTQDCAFHVVGEIFDTVYIGEPPGNKLTGVQTFEVPAGGGMIYELIADVPGSFPFVNHKSGHGDKGATGLLIVEP